MHLLSAMETYVQVIDTGSFSAAARRLRIGQPAISKTIAQLERQLGVRLLLRSTHGLTPTEAGSNFYEHARRTLSAADEAVTSTRGLSATLTGRLRVSGPVTFVRLHIMPHLADFLAEHPALDVDMFLEDRNIDLVEGGIDVALRMGAQADSSLTARRLGQNPRLVMGTPAYFSRTGRPQVPQDLLNHNAVIYDLRGGGSGWEFRQGKQRVPVTVHGRLRTTGMEAVREAVLSGIGLSIMSEWMFRRELASGEIQAVLTDWTLPPIDLWAVSPAGRAASAKSKAFISFVEARVFGKPSPEKP
ncbi:LysR family transcriptional regulator [Cedecea neteri]|uniref:Transcriptional regulator n=1 Tax=Cedecea neteri TaxID=158822 RepID=A0AAN0S2R0_9ENTR|nr:LysR family transcriptional regulator [Cedecea neteri]AIR60441.1 transcriptional regulator [Cedecea neteri]WNJ79239.1 LysR family transcriptional regulator [Cedecea neteri]